MTGRWMAVFFSVVVANTFAAVAWSQTPQRPPTLAERMAALRNGWTGGEQQSSAAQPGVAAPQGAVPRVSGRSLIPGGFLGRGNPSSAAGNQPQDQANSSARYSTPPRAGSAPAQVPANRDHTLPGLGGSPLPSTVGSSPQRGLAPSDDITPIGSSRYSPSRYTIGQPGGAATGTNSTVRDSAAANASQVSSPAVRQSPHRRAPMHTNAGDLSRELIGSFPTTRVASTPDAASAHAPTDADHTDDEPTPTPADAAFSLPTADEPAPATPATAQPTPQVRSGSQPIGDGATIGDALPRNVPGAAPSASPSVRLRSTLSGAPVPTAQASGFSSPAAAQHRQMFGGAQGSASADPAVLASQQTPLITTDIRGPRQILVGREATYRLRLENQGTAAAEGLIASIRIPTWAEVIDTTASRGTVQQSAGAGSTGVLEWQLARLEGHAHETLDLRLVPRASRPLELGINWTLAPVGSRAVVEVQEPKLDISVTGPDEVLFGKPQLFRLTISNPGTGTAEDVKINLLPPGGGEAAVSTHPLGDLPPGASKIIDVELTAREAGKLSIKAHAAATGGLAADGDKEVFCRKPELDVDWRGPDQKYAGTQATYYFRVRNPGTAPADEVTVTVALPQGVEFAGASDGQSFDAQRREVTWRVGTLGPGDDSYMELKCVMKSPGANQLKVAAATAGGELTASKVAETNVVALADLKLEVSDPSGPVAVGEEAVYEIRVKNRGASAAQAVNIVALFSAGIEPDQAEGALYTVADGRVSFRTIDELPAGREISLRVRAHAVQPGNHVFRAEVLCKDLDIKLAAEETTRFYSDDVSSGDHTHQQAEGGQPFGPSTLR